jgi:hypothetical protein
MSLPSLAKRGSGVFGAEVVVGVVFELIEQLGLPGSRPAPA